MRADSIAAADHVEIACRSWEHFERTFSRRLAGEQVFVPSASQLAQGSALQLRFALPDGTRIGMPARVVSTSPPEPGDRPGMLLELGALSTADELRVLDLLRSLDERRNAARTTEPAVPSPPAQPARVSPARAPEPAAPSPPAQPARVLDTRLHDDLFQLKQRDEYGVLGLQRGAGDAAIRAAYLALSKRYHPHRVARHNSEELRRVSTELYVLVQRAYARLTGSERLPVHEGEKRRTNKKSARDDVDKAISEAVQVLGLNQYEQAISMLGAVVSEHPDRPNAKLWLTIAGARYARSKGELDAAEECYRTVLELGPGNAEAKEQLAQLATERAQAAKAESRPGLLDRLWRKKS